LSSEVVVATVGPQPIGATAAAEEVAETEAEAETEAKAKAAQSLGLSNGIA